MKRNWELVPKILFKTEKIMWILIVLTLQSGVVTTAPFTAEKECMKAASWVMAYAGFENRPDLQPLRAACFKTN